MALRYLHKLNNISRSCVLCSVAKHDCIAKQNSKQSVVPNKNVFVIKTKNLGYYLNDKRVIDLFNFK